MSTLDDLRDRAAIHDVVVGYFFAVDRRDWDAVGACFTPDAQLDYSVFRGGVTDVVGAIASGLSQFERTMHFGGNVLIELRGDEAHCQSYAICHHRLQRDGATWDRVCGLRYVDDLVRHDGGWRIHRRIAEFVWDRLDHVQVPST